MTEGKWTASGAEVTSDGKHVATCWINPDIPPDEAEDNARKIVATRDACQAYLELHHLFANPLAEPVQAASLLRALGWPGGTYEDGQRFVHHLIVQAVAEAT